MKSLRLFLVLAIVLAGLGFAFPAKAGAFTYTSSINLQNLENSTASITVYFYNQDGTQDPNSPVTDTITPLGSKVYFPIQAATGFNGSVIVQSNTQVASVSNILGNSGAAAASYVAATTGGTTMLLPLLMKANGGYNTWFNIQNTGGSDATVTVNYSDGTSANGTIKAGASKTFDQAAEAHTPKVFSAIVTSNQPVAATVIEESTKVMFAYSGFASGANNPVLPLINENNSGYVTGVNILNSGASSTDVTLSYTPSAFGTACTETQTVPAGQSVTFALFAFYNGANSTCTGGQRFVGSAKVTTNSASMPLTVIVNQLKGSQNGEAYGAFDPTAATPTVVLPLIMNANGGYFTSINLMNVGTGAATVTCTFTPYASVTLPVLTQTLQPNTGVSWLQAAANEFGTTKYVGSATCNAPGGQIVAIVNELGASGTADQLLVYEGISLP